MRLLRVSLLAMITACVVMGLTAPSAIAGVHGQSTGLMITRNESTYGQSFIAPLFTQLNGTRLLTAASPSSTSLMAKCPPADHATVDPYDGNPCPPPSTQGSGGGNSTSGGECPPAGRATVDPDTYKPCKTPEPCPPAGRATVDPDTYKPCKTPEPCPPAGRATVDPYGNPWPPRSPRVDDVVLVTVPNIVSRTVDRARGALRAVGLVLGNDPAGDTRVQSQAPAAGTLVCPGSVVTVTTVVTPETTAVTPQTTAVTPQTTAVTPQTTAVTPEPTVVTPVVPAVTLSKLIPWLWLLIPLAVGLLVILAVRARRGQKWVRGHVRAVPGAAPGAVVEVMESRTNHSPPTQVVRLEPHADSGTQIFEEVDR
jgi:hypothetical protein